MLGHFKSPHLKEQETGLTRNCSESRGRPRTSPLPGGISIVIKSPRHCCRSGNPVLHLLPAPAPVILAAAGIQSPCCHPHGWRMEVLPRLRRSHCCPKPCWRIDRALDPRCGEDDEGQSKGPVSQGGRDSVKLTLSHKNIVERLTGHAGRCGHKGSRLMDAESFRRTVGKGRGFS